MNKDEFIERIVQLKAELELSIWKDDYNDIERQSKRIGRLIQKYLNDRKAYIDKDKNQ